MCSCGFAATSFIFCFMSRLTLDPFVFTKKTAFMQRVADLVRSGHNRYVQGTVPLEKAGAFAAKIDRLYAVGVTRLQAHRARKDGLASARLLLLWQEQTGPAPSLHWVLLVTDGELPAEADREAWRDPRQTRITLTGYELVRVTKPEAKAPVWTWRYTRSRYDELRLACLLAIRHHQKQELTQLIDSIWRSPGFSGIRDQVKKLQEAIVGEWNRTRARRDMRPPIPEHLGYVRRLEDKGKKLSGIKAALTRKEAKERQTDLDLD